MKPTKALLCLAVAAAALASCKKKDNNTPAAPNLTINGVTWADCNVGDDQTFADKPDMYTPLYAFGSNPCPEGWRLPTKAELEALHSAGSTWANAKTRGNAVNGRFYGASHATALLPDNMEGCIFLPAAGYRSSDSSLFYQSHNGYYWSSTPNISGKGYSLFFDNGTSNPDISEDRASGLSVRCVQ